MKHPLDLLTRKLFANLYIPHSVPKSGTPVLILRHLR